MDATDAESPDLETPTFSVAALACSPNRTVFTEDDHDDAWISTDTTVEIRR